MKRRNFIKSALIASATGAAITGGIITPRLAFADSTNTDVAQSKSLEEALKLMGVSDAAESDMIKLKTPEIAENGGLVPVTVTSNLDDTSEIVILVSNNPLPYAAKYTMAKGVQPAVKSRLKISKAAPIIMRSFVVGVSHTFICLKAMKNAGSKTRPPSKKLG